MKTASLQDCPIHRSVHTKPISQSAGVLVATNLQYRLIINNERMLLSCGQLELEPDSSTNHHEEEPSEYTKHFCVVIITHHAQEFSPKISRGEAIRGEDEVHGFLRNFQASCKILTLSIVTRPSLINLKEGTASNPADPSYAEP